MTTLPEDAIVITSADVDTFSLWYYQYGLEYREDIKIVTRGLVQFDWYRQNLSHTYPGIMLPHIDQGNLEKVIGLLNPGSSICTSHYDPQEDGGGCICE